MAKGRNKKLTTDPNARPEQREQTEKLKKVTENWTPLQKTPPSYMKGTLAATVWQRLIPILQETGVVKQADKATVECLCSAIQLYREAFENVQKNGIQREVWTTPILPTGETLDKEFTRYQKNPAVTTMDSAMKQIKTFSSDLGLTPASRASLMASVDSQDDDTPSLAEILNAKSGDFL